MPLTEDQIDDWSRTMSTEDLRLLRDRLSRILRDRDRSDILDSLSTLQQPLVAEVDPTRDEDNSREIVRAPSGLPLGWAIRDEVLECLRPWPAGVTEESLRVALPYQPETIDAAVQLLVLDGRVERSRDPITWSAAQAWRIRLTPTVPPQAAQTIYEELAQHPRGLTFDELFNRTAYSYVATERALAQLIREGRAARFGEVCQVATPLEPPAPTDVFDEPDLMEDDEFGQVPVQDLSNVTDHQWVVRTVRSMRGRRPTLEALQGLRPPHFTAVQIRQCVRGLLENEVLIEDNEGSLHARSPRPPFHGEVEDDPTPMSALDQLLADDD